MTALITADAAFRATRTVGFGADAALLSPEIRQPLDATVSAATMDATSSARFIDATFSAAFIDATTWVTPAHAFRADAVVV